MAHALHPNYPDKHEEHHRPELQKGLVIKHNANQRYATSAVTAFLFKEIARLHNLPVQVFNILHFNPQYHLFLLQIPIMFEQISVLQDG
jgi:aspartyl aminopeptidase